MQIGKAFYCDQCGCEIANGTHCNECDPNGGSQQVTYTFVATLPPEERTQSGIVQKLKQIFNKGMEWGANL